MMKTLIAAACVAVIVIAGLMFRQAQQSESRRVDAAGYRACQNMLHDIRTASVTESPSEQAMKGCMFSGHYSPTDLQQAFADMKAKRSF
jgi:hypothetical protein